MKNPLKNLISGIALISSTFLGMGLENKVLADTIYVPSQHSTIQSAIDSSQDGDEIIVEQGRYLENINFNGKNIILRSTNPHNQDIVKNTIIDGNRAGHAVTFAGNEGTTSTLKGFTIMRGGGNSGFDSGGGIYCFNSSPSISHCIIEKNRVEGINIMGGGTTMFGGGIYCFNSTTIINNCIIKENSVIGGPGGDWRYPIDGQGRGGGIYGDNITILNSIIFGNSASTKGGGGGFKGDNSIIKNSIFWSNSSNQIDGNSTPTYSCIQDWTGGGEGNISLDPQFVDAENGDFRLRPTSPCIDAGTTIEDLLYDIVGIRRPQGRGYDIGAYEFINSSGVHDWDKYE